MRNRIAGALVVPAFLLLTSCQPEFRIALASAGERIPRPQFTVEEPALAGRSPRFHTIKVMNEEKVVVWHVRAEPFGDRNGVSRFTYGEAPAGFATVVTAGPLKPGQSYAAVVIGTAYGSLRFRVDAEGRVR
jgi:hypothetical protein